MNNPNQQKYEIEQIQEVVIFWLVNQAKMSGKDQNGPIMVW